MREPDAKVVLVTGASSGIGAAVARAAARRGHRPILVARRAEPLEQLAAELRAGGTDALTIAADLAEPAAPERVISTAVEEFGGLDVLINNAGIGLPHVFSQADPDAIRHQIEVNFVAPLLLTRHALPELIARRGMVINIGSAITSVANAALGAYGATKAGLAYWNDALRRELRHRGVRVCLVEPGPVATGFFAAIAGYRPRADVVYNPIGDPPPKLLTAKAETVARRVVALIDRPRRRVGVPRGVVWPFRLVGGLFQLWPWLGDAVITAMVRHLESPPTPLPHRRPSDARATR
jgi:short-subunit dehydrogenase